TSVKYLKGVGRKRAEALARLGIRTVGDLLYHAPHRYLDATTVTPLARVRVGQEASCVGHVVTTGVLPTRRGLRVFRAVLKDDSGLLECAWPGQPFLERQIKPGQPLLVTGPVRYHHGRECTAPARLRRRRRAGGASRSTSSSISSWCRRAPAISRSGPGPGSGSCSRRSSPPG